MVAEHAGRGRPWLWADTGRQRWAEQPADRLVDHPCRDLVADHDGAGERFCERGDYGGPG
ncbi:hypothetical protein [Sorangium sp. So ce388]|uniref:hypothetical protein n=1 Tax=Sorangium sp. So ce388 TaxID=3133309 RepID=UPI003F5C628B